MEIKNMLKPRIIWLTLLCMVIFPILYGQQGYSFKFRIKGLKDTTCLLAYYFSNGTYIKDTLKVDGAGRCSYKAPSTLPKGLYALVITDKNYFDFVVNNDYRFSMETSVVDPSSHMVIKGSPENDLFYQYLRVSREKYEQIQVYENGSKRAADRSRRSPISLFYQAVKRIQHLPTVITKPITGMIVILRMTGWFERPYFTIN